MDAKEILICSRINTDQHGFILIFLFYPCQSVSHSSVLGVLLETHKEPKIIGRNHVIPACF
jgi:hypothetical protein